MSNASYCWFCSKALVGPGGAPGKEPLFFREVTIYDNNKVRVHAACEKAAIAFCKVFTAQPTPPQGERHE